MITTLLYLIIDIAIIGLVFWLITGTRSTRQLPIPEPIRTVIRGSWLSLSF